MLKPGEGAIGTSRETIFGTRVTFSCPPGQEFATGRSKVMTECMPGGKWSVSYIPDCQGKHIAREKCLRKPRRQMFGSYIYIYNFSHLNMCILLLPSLR